MDCSFTRADLLSLDIANNKNKNIKFRVWALPACCVSVRIAVGGRVVGRQSAKRSLNFSAQGLSLGVFGFQARCS